MQHRKAVLVFVILNSSKESQLPANLSTSLWVEMATSSLIESRFRAAVRSHDVRAVPMNGFDCVIFSQTPCIGIDALGSCSVSLIISPLAAILGHVLPCLDGSNIDDPNVGDNHIRGFMDWLIALFHQYQRFFPGSPLS